MVQERVIIYQKHLFGGNWQKRTYPQLYGPKQQIVFDCLPNDQSNFVSVKHVSLLEGVADIGDLCVYSRPEIWPHWSEIPKTHHTDLLR